MIQIQREGSWHKETPAERAAFEAWKRKRRRREPHAMISRKRLPWLYCSRCGLVNLKNKATRAAMRAGCEVDE